MNDNREYQLLCEINNGQEAPNEEVDESMNDDGQPEDEPEMLEIHERTANERTRRRIVLHIPWGSAFLFVMSLTMFSFSASILSFYFDKLAHQSNLKSLVIRKPHQNPYDKHESKASSTMNDIDRLHEIYPKCDTRHPDRLWNHWCDLELNVKECGYDNGACVEFNEKYKGKCHVKYPTLLGNGICDDMDLYNTEECQWDGGDCLSLK